MKHKKKTPMQKFEKLWAKRVKKTSPKKRRKIDSKIFDICMYDDDVGKSWAKRFCADLRGSDSDSEKSV